MGTRSSAWLASSPPRDGYVLEGTVLQARPAARLRTPGASRLGPSVAAWRIRRGSVNGVDVAGAVVLVVLTCSPGGPDERISQLILLDEGANPEQVLGLVDAFRGRLGGPLADQARRVTEQLGFAQVPISYRLHGTRAVVSVPDRFRLVFRLEPAGASDPVIGRPAHASEVWIHLPEHDLVGAGHDCPAAYRQFRFRCFPRVRAQRAPAKKEESP